MQLAMSSLQRNLKQARGRYFPNRMRQFDIGIYCHSRLETHQPCCHLKGHMQNYSIKNELYYHGERWVSIQHARLRIGCSALNHDLCYNLHVRDNATCRCGAMQENVNHFFMECRLFSEARNALRISIEQITIFDLKTLLYGNSDLTRGQNKAIFDAVHKYITDTNRFT